MSLPKITVITISYNSASTIERTIRSVIEQKYNNLEYIIIDGASTDGTQNIIGKYKDYIDVFISEKDNGISNAFNKGIALSTGELIVLVNSDDYLLNGALKKVADTWDGKSDIWSGNYIAEGTKTSKRFRIHPSLKFPIMPFFKKPVHQGRFIKRGLYERIGMYDEKIHYPMDMDFLIRATKAKAVFQYVDTDVAVFSLGGATEQSIFKKRKDYVYMIRKNGGNLLQAYIYYIFLILTQEIKKTLYIKGTDITKLFRYKKA